MIVQTEKEDEWVEVVEINKNSGGGEINNNFKQSESCFIIDDEDEVVDDLPTDPNQIDSSEFINNNKQKLDNY